MNVFLRKFLLGISLVVLTCNFSLAQVSLIAPSLVVDQGETISADIRVTGFTDIISMQFTLQWDSTILSYSNLSDFDLPQLNGGNFNTMSTSGGQLTLSWIDNDLAGITMPDSAAIFTINFEVIGPDHSTTPIVFTSSPTSVEIIGYVNGDDQVLGVNLVHGLVNVGGISSVEENKIKEPLSIQQNFPNPFKEATYLPFDLSEADDVNVAIYDNYGRLIFEEQNFFSAGKHQIRLESSIFPSGGIYTIKLFTSNFLATKQLIFLN